MMNNLRKEVGDMLLEAGLGDGGEAPNRDELDRLADLLIEKISLNRSERGMSRTWLMNRDVSPVPDPASFGPGDVVILKGGMAWILGEDRQWRHHGRYNMAESYFQDVGDFHRKFGLEAYPGSIPPSAMADDVARFRIDFLCEELAEFIEASGYPTPAATVKNVGKAVKAWTGRVSALNSADPDLEKAADALADLVYVALGTAHLMGIPFDAIWSEVQRANMMKERAAGASDYRSKRGHHLDVVKPAGWKPPNHRSALELAARLHFQRFREAEAEDAKKYDLS